MDVSVRDKKLQKVLENRSLLNKRFGKLAKNILLRLSELSVVENLGQISIYPPPRRHKMSGRSSTWSIDVSANYRIWIYGGGEEDPNLVTAVEIIDILDDH